MQIVNHQKTKVVATVGPASSSYETLLELVKAGVNVFRLNFSHGEHSEHEQVIHHIIRINETYGLFVGIIADLQGPKIRIDEIEGGTMPLEKGDILYFQTKPCAGNKEGIQINYTEFPKDVKAGERIVVDDAKVVLQVLETDGVERVKLEVLFGSELSSRKGVNLPDTAVTLPALTDKDVGDLEFILTQPVHWIALSFVRSFKEIRNLQERIAVAKHPAKVVAKIEKPEAIKRINKIIKQTDAIMIARGDLGVEVPMERLPSMQKMIINKCLQEGKPVIVATQLMDSMVTNPSPTRAEILDVANAVLDGTDAVMLSAETAVGNHPVKVVEAMNRIVTEAEKNYELSKKRPKASSKSPTYLSDVICYNAGKTAMDIGAVGIVGMTKSGYTGFKVASYRPKNCDVYIFSDETYTLCMLNLVWGVKGFYYDSFTSTDETIVDVIKILKAAKAVQKGDYVVNTGAMPLHQRYRTNFLKITLVE
ncbi:MAG: pyruvate kinase [Saprospiraceae bacterium]|nr:pyruvate kinase [Saprospiraceae bacterium]